MIQKVQAEQTDIGYTGAKSVSVAGTSQLWCHKVVAAHIKAILLITNSMLHTHTHSHGRQVENSRKWCTRVPCDAWPGCLKTYVLPHITLLLFGCEGGNITRKCVFNLLSNACMSKPRVWFDIRCTVHCSHKHNFAHAQQHHKKCSGIPTQLCHIRTSWACCSVYLCGTCPSCSEREYTYISSGQYDRLLTYQRKSGVWIILISIIPIQACESSENQTVWSWSAIGRLLYIFW